MAPVGIPATVGASPLDAPPPNPATGAPGQPPFSAQGIAGPGGVPSTGMPPQILTGLMQSAQSMSDMLDSFAQVTPDKAPQLNLIKELLQRYLADVTVAGAGPTSPTASGPAFPGGGIDRGLASAGTV